MKGIIFNLLEEVITEEYDEDAWDLLLEAASVEGAYSSLGSYPDGEFLKLLAEMPAAVHAPREDLIRWFGRKAIPILAERYPIFFEPHDSTRSFLLTLNDIIHPEVRKLYPDADVPVFDFHVREDVESLPNQALALGYRSARRLCTLAEGFIAGAADHYEERVSIEQPKCMNRGDDSCLLICSIKSNVKTPA